ncbi:MAG: type 2 isopentenyl-diphosphate Delta-isomerase [Synechococcales bacterium]|nr:type 2 isopentenyl-diphosphate Delta-isomerase [Synechococcales bacterium]
MAELQVPPESQTQLATQSLSEPRNSSETQSRKADHLRVCLEEAVECRQITTGLEQYYFTHVCLPDRDFSEISLVTQFLGKSLGAPLLISSMTGGTDLAKQINLRLAAIAQTYRLAMGVGSQRVAIEQPQVSDSFQIRQVAPDALLFANLGAVQLNYTYGLEQCLKAVDLLEADALILHLNVLQEAVQTRGDKNFKGLLDKIATLCEKLPVPVITKEVGNGISGSMAKQLIAAGVRAIDVAGAGGTSWAKVEAQRATDPLQRRLGETFADWGISTADCLVQVRQVAPTIPLIASGGLRNGLEMAKCIALGADLAGLALPFLQAAHESADALDQLVQFLTAELKVAMFCTGTQTIAQLQTQRLEKIN